MKHGMRNNGHGHDIYRQKKEILSQKSHTNNLMIQLLAVVPMARMLALS
jgi:hypothetical protein